MNLRILVGIVPASALVAGGLLLAPSAGADICNDGAVKPDGGGADGYYTCFGREWIHTVPFHDPNSADGYGPNQTLPPICIRFPKNNPCPTGTPPAGATASSVVADGTYVVGQDVAPGLYRSAGGRGGNFCVWFHHAGIGNGNADAYDGGSSRGQTFTRILANEGSFETDYCQPWERVGD